MKFSPATIVLTLGLSASVAMATAAPAATLVKGEVRKIDEAAGKVTLKHGPIKALDMDEDGMTMVFRVQDAGLLKQVKVGDRVQFEVVRTSAGLTITRLEKAR